MPVWPQHLLVILIVVACVAFVVYQATRSLAGKRSKIGSCCAKGCEAPKPNEQQTKVQFMPVEMLTLKKK